MKRFSLCLWLGTLLVLESCTPSAGRQQAVVHVYIADFDYLNPVVMTETTSRQMCDLIFPRLLSETFDSTLGMLTYKPSLALRWEIADSNRSITYHLRNDVKWTDGKPVTARDWRFTYDLYADTAVASSRQNFLDDFLRTPSGEGKPVLDLNKAVEVTNDSTLTVRFQKPLPKELMFKYTNLGFIAEHVWKDVDRKFIRKDERNFSPDKIIGCGPFKVEKWTRTQECIMVSNEACTLPHPAKIKRFITRFVPEYTTRLTLLQKGEADIVQTLSPADALKLKSEDGAIEIREVGYVAYDYIAWMNIDAALYKKTKEVKPHPLFGSKKVRQALTTAINRQALIDGFLKGFGKAGESDIPPVCKWALNPNLKPFAYDAAKARKLLEEDGWKLGSDGVLEKSGKKFSFQLTINAGNARRNYAATVVQDNLKEIGIECKIEQMESNLMLERTRTRELDCFLFGWNVSPPDVDPTETRSDFRLNPFNLVAYENPKVYELMALGKSQLNLTDAAPMWRDYAAIVNDEQPETILYWWTSLVGVSKRLKNVDINPVAVFDNLHEWTIEDAK